jgi:hypothetical protein
VSVGDALLDLRGRETDHADKRVKVERSARLLPEDPYGLLESRRIDGIPFASRAKDVNVPEAQGDRATDLVAEDRLDELLLVVPWDRARDHHALRIPWHSVLLTAG